MSLWINHPRTGKPDAALSIAIYTTAIVLVKVLFCNVEFGSLKVGCIDAGTIGALLAPTLAAYVARKHKDPVKEKEEDVQKD